MPILPDRRRTERTGDKRGRQTERGGGRGGGDEGRACFLAVAQFICRIIHIVPSDYLNLINIILWLKELSA